MISWPFKSNKSDISVQVKQEVASILDNIQMENNSVSNGGIRQRIAQAISGGNDFADALHNIFTDYGYPQQLDFNNFWNMYRRFGVARNVVELPVDTGWLQEPTVDSSNQPFLNEFEELVKKVNLWNRLRALDTRQRVGRYAGMFMRVRDNKKPEMPLELNSLNGVASIIGIIPVYEGQLRISNTESDPLKDDFGLPTMYEFNSSSTGNRNEKNATSFNIHPSRLVIAAEGADNGGIFGISSLEAPFNSLMDLRKIIGGGAEGFYKNAAQNIVFSLKDTASAKGNEAMLKKFNEMYDEFAANRFRRAIWVPGMDATVLNADLVQPKEFFDSALNDIAAGSKIPATILIGQQTGRLASSEDSKQFLSVINSRRENFMTEMTRDVIDWFILNNILPTVEYEIVWDDLLALSQQDRLTNSKTMTEINEKQFKAGQDMVFSSEEVREESGFDPEELPDSEGEELPDSEDITG